VIYVLTVSANRTVDAADLDWKMTALSFLQRVALTFRGLAVTDQTYHLTLLNTCLILACAFALHQCPAEASVPKLLAHQHYQSPVHGGPSELLFLAGANLDDNDTVTYQLATEGNDPPILTEIPRESSAEIGVAEVVSTASTPHALVVLLPESMHADRTYVLRVRNQNGDWSNAVKINDERPLWFSPAYVYQLAQPGQIRNLKVIGRNLQAKLGHRARLRLRGPQTITLTSQTQLDAPLLAEFTLAVQLPSNLIAGKYRIEISVNGATWQAIADQQFEVRKPVDVRVQLRLGDSQFGKCNPDDTIDDSACLQAMLAEAERVDGDVRIPAGTWLVTQATTTNGFLIPSGVNLIGSGRDRTTVRASFKNDKRSARAMFTLLGNNEVRGITFSSHHESNKNGVRPVALQLGQPPVGAETEKSIPAITNILISENTFDRVEQGIVDSGRPIQFLTITNNVFGARKGGIYLGGNRFTVGTPFRIDDAVITSNRFYPGSYTDPLARQGVIASEIGAGHRVDFSDNVADGGSSMYLDNEQDPKGWRAGFFWHLNNNQEMLLIANNTASCTGDKSGDGEAIVLDNNANTFAFDEPKVVIEASSKTVTVLGTPIKVQNNREVAINQYYRDHYIQIGDGPGLGQVRAITSYEIKNDHTTFIVSPDWDVLPSSHVSRINIGKEFWQAYLIGNEVDHRTPLCGKTNRNARKGGSIGIAGQTADSIVAYNRQYDTDGIIYHQFYSARDRQCNDCYRGTNYLNFVEIAHNHIIGEYDWSDGCSSSGILGSLAASPSPIALPTTVGFGISIAHNTIDHADAWRGGAIALSPTWHEGPPPSRWPLVNGTLIQHNRIENIFGAIAKPCQADKALPRMGINMGRASLAHGTVLHANSCKNVLQPLVLGWNPVQRVCNAPSPDSCECR
jgi:hypothetical protein